MHQIRGLAFARVDRRPAFALAALVTASTAIRGFFALKHTVAEYFPDEYVYAALGRSLAHGHLAIRGQSSHFPAILEPLLAAPLWRFFSTVTAYHLVQLENALFASLVAIPIYLLARWVGLGRRYAFFCVVYALLLPDLTLIPLVVSDLVAYPLIIAAVFAGVRAVDTPTARRQAAFLALATLSTLARVEYAVVVPAYLVAAVVIERRRVLRAHWLSFAAIVPAAIAVVAGASSYYLRSGLGGLELHPFALGHWFVLQAFLMAVVTGVVLALGAVAALLRPDGRREKIFAIFVGTFVLLVLAASTEVAAQTTRFKERYLFCLLPLIAVAFGMYLRRRPLRPLVLALAAAVGIALAELPLSAYSASIYKGDSQFLWGVWFLQVHLGTATAPLLVALVASCGCLAAAAVAFGRFTRMALAATLAFVAVFTTLSLVEDIHDARVLRAAFPGKLTWVDDAVQAPVTAVATVRDVPTVLREELFWNPSIRKEVVLPGAIPSDVFGAPVLRLTPGGRMVGVRGDILFQDMGAYGLLADARRVAHIPGFTVWRPVGVPRFRILISHRYWDGWLADRGAIRAWPSSRHRGVRVSFTVSLPPAWKRVRLQLGRASILIRPGSSRRVVCTGHSGALNVRYSSPNAVYDSALRLVSTRLTNVRVTDVGAGPPEPGPACAGAG